MKLIKNYKQYTFRQSGENKYVVDQSLAYYFCYLLVCRYFLLPRLFVYHAMSSEENVRAQLLVMEQKLPFHCTFFVFSHWLWRLASQLNLDYYLAQLWFWAKLIFVALHLAYIFNAVVTFDALRLANNPIATAFTAGLMKRP